MKLYDAHCHLNEEHIFPHWEEYFQKFVDAGGAGIVNVGANQFYNEKGIEIATSKKNSSVIVKSTLGFHPEVIGTELKKEDFIKKIEELKYMVLEYKDIVVAIGECGFDFHYPGSEQYFDLQKELFILQCELARELHLPLVVHSRDAFDQTLEILKQYTDLIIYVHCRGYGPEELLKLQKIPFKKLYIGFCGNLTYKKADNLRESLKFVPLTSLLLETDAPYLSPQVVRGEINHPAHVQYLYDFVSNFLNLDKYFLAQQLANNFYDIYGIK